MLLVLNSRDGMLEILPKGGVVAEIGVADGDFSRKILDLTQPRELHLIDPWVHQDRDDYRDDPQNLPPDASEERYQSVVKRFAPEIGAGRVQIHRRFSTDVAPEFPDAHFDWIYVDGMHTRDACLADLRAYAPKVRPDGLILGHDYANHTMAQRMGFGVIEAVNEFVRDGGAEFLALGYEAYPTYILARDANTPATQAFRVRLMHDLSVVLDIRDFAALPFFQNLAVFSDGVQKVIYTLG